MRCACGSLPTAAAPSSGDRTTRTTARSNRALTVGLNDAKEFQKTVPTKSSNRRTATKELQKRAAKKAETTQQQHRASGFGPLVSDLWCRGRGINSRASGVPKARTRLANRSEETGARKQEREKLLWTRRLPIERARARIQPYIYRTPLITSRLIDRSVGCEMIFKTENLQKIGAFKARGACKALFSLNNATLQRGVITHSSGNQGAALAWAAQLRQTTCCVVMPRNATEVKKHAVANYGTEIAFCESSFANPLLRNLFYETSFTKPLLRAFFYEPSFAKSSFASLLLRTLFCEPSFANPLLRTLSGEPRGDCGCAYGGTGGRASAPL